jgi:tripeptidyl-peptidase-1
MRRSTILLLFVGFLSVYASAELHYNRVVLSKVESWPKTWARISRSDPTEKISFVIALKQNNLDLLQEIFNRVSDPQSSDYAMYLTKEQVNQIVAPSPTVQKQFLDWLSAHGLELNNDYTIEGDVIMINAHIGIIEHLFNTKLFVFKKDEKAVHRVQGPYSIPRHLSEHISFVSGLTNFPKPTKAQLFGSKFSSLPGFVQVPYSIKNQYNMPQNLVNRSPKNSQSVVQFIKSHSFSYADLYQFQKGNNVPNTTITTLGKFIGNNLESTLDIQYITGIGVGVPTLFWTLDDWIYEFSVQLSAMSSPPLVVSVSWDSDERDICDSTTNPTYNCQGLGINNQTYIDRINTEFMKVGLRGVTLIVSSGDNGVSGSEGCEPMPLNPYFPSASPYVTSVGATHIYSEPAPVRHNTPKDLPPVCQMFNCTYPSSEVGESWSGGGFSIYSDMPSYQQSAVQQYLQQRSVPFPDKSLFNASKRAYPDISLNGHNFLLVTGGEWSVVDGTSGSAPVLGGMIAMMNDWRLSNNKPPLGFFNPLLYQMYQQAPSAFTDITEGSNSCMMIGACCTTGFFAVAGWDAVTGVGTPNYSNMLQYIQSINNPAWNNKN